MVVIPFSPPEIAVMDKKNRPYVNAVLSCAGFGLLVGAVIYAFHGRLAAWRLDGKEGLLWEIVLKAVAGYVAVIGAVITAFKYIDEKARQREQDLKAEFRQREQDSRDDKKDFLKERRDVYKRLGAALAGIMNHDPDDPNDDGWIPAKEKFYEIYWGEIRLVADGPVMALVEAFSDALFGVENSKQKQALVDQVTQISTACRDSLGDSWKDISKAEEVSARSILASTSGAPLTPIKWLADG
jgi:hypothetical protein